MESNFPSRATFLDTTFSDKSDICKSFGYHNMLLSSINKSFPVMR